MKAHRVGFIGAAFVLSLLFSQKAHAAEGSASASVGTEGATGEASGEGVGETAEGEEEKEPTVEVGIDAVFGFGDVPAVNISTPTTLGTLGTHNLENTHVASDSYLLGFEYHLSKNLFVGARLPLVHATFGPEGLQQSRGVATIGNLELAAGFEKKLSKKLGVVAELGLALPTAAGDELPKASEIAEDPTAKMDDASHDRFSALQAASASRGLEESALFSPKRLGIIPKIEVEYHAGKLTVAPYVKLENLISTSSSNEKGYLGELVPGALVTYSVIKYLDVGLRAWASIAFDKEDHDNNALIVVEPQLRGKIGPLRPIAGLLLPIFPATGPGNTYNPPEPYEPVFDPRFLALRLALSGEF